MCNDIIAEKIGLVLPNGKIYELDLLEEINIEHNSDSQFAKAAKRAFRGCKYSVRHRDDMVNAYSDLIFKQSAEIDRYFDYIVCLTEDKIDELHNLVFYRNGEWNSVKNFVAKCNLLGNTSATKDWDGEYWTKYPITIAQVIKSEGKSRLATISLSLKIKDDKKTMVDPTTSELYSKDLGRKILVRLLVNIV